MYLWHLLKANPVPELLFADIFKQHGTLFFTVKELVPMCTTDEQPPQNSAVKTTSLHPVWSRTSLQGFEKAVSVNLKLAEHTHGPKADTNCWLSWR